jgi:hypothetical protein
MTLDERFVGANLRRLFPALLVAAAAFIALLLLIDRFDRIAQARPIVGSDRNWKAETGTELRLRGLSEGPLLGVETDPGGGLIVHAAAARLLDGGATQRLNFKVEGAKGEDNKAKVQVTLVGKDGSVTLSRSGEAVMPQLRIRVENAELKVDTSVTIGDSLMVPSRTIVFGEKELAPNGLGFSFIVPPGGAVAIEFPAFPDGTPSGVVPWLGAVREEQEDTVLAVREAGIFREGTNAPDEAVCAANQRYAWALFFRPTLFPVPTGADCRPGPMTGRDFSIDKDSVAVSLAGYAWHMQEGKPSFSLWSWAKSNPVLSLLINWGLPAAVAWIFGLITWRRTAVATKPAEPKKNVTGKTRRPGRSRAKRVP